ncbi:hypothetical protein ACFFNY_12910 [Paenibacillus hodogayensis]|uniref:S-adenosylmethionine decarboxylase n=1 Tax=Paenibacillus hodogayensis TaxID=279208 RepID=A0ABV5VVX0_9BACL
MGRHAGLRKMALWLALLLLILWPISRIYGYLTQHRESANASLLLFQVSQFQIELLNSSLAEATKAGDTKELDALRLSAYSANYVHERLVQAVGDDRLTPLRSVEQLVQCVLRLQIGGSRALKADEKEALGEASRAFKDVYEGYGKLLTSSGKLVSSQNDKVAKLDEQLAELLKKKLLR